MTAVVSRVARDASVPVVVSWSGGKDAALVLHRLQQDPRVQVVGLVATVTLPALRSAMHGIPRDVLEAQAAAIGLPLTLVPVLPLPSNAAYEAAWATALEPLRQQGVRTIAFGDLFLQDIRTYRETVCARWGFEPVFPIWGTGTAEIAEEIWAAGLRAIVCCATRRLGPAVVGQEFNPEFVRNLPVGVDPCGENGEFHTFVASGPGWKQTVPYVANDVIAVGEYWTAQWSDNPAPSVVSREDRRSGVHLTDDRCRHRDYPVTNARGA